MSEFIVRTTGKWILAGEHAVLRGSPALVFPLHSRSLELRYKGIKTGGPIDHLGLIVAGKHGEEVRVLFWGVLERACELKKIHRETLRGMVEIKNEIPLGAGLGASAALCVAVARWFRHLELVPESEIPEFARVLENLFHGESSGVDIAIAVTGKALRFKRGEAPRFLEMHWSPPLYLSYSGQRGVTLECVNQVKALFDSDPTLAARLDQKMSDAVAMCEAALLSPKVEGLALLTKALQEAESCFEQWGLVQGTLQKHLKKLHDAGALAAKPTGSGQGGYTLSLWEKPPPEQLGCFESGI